MNIETNAVTLTNEEAEALKLARDTHKKTRQSDGFTAGTNWAKNPAHYSELAAIVSAFHQKRGNENWKPRSVLELWEDMDSDEIGHFNAWCVENGVTKFDHEDSDFALGFFDGAHAVFESAEALA